LRCLGAVKLLFVAKPHRFLGSHELSNLSAKKTSIDNLRNSRNTPVFRIKFNQINELKFMSSTSVFTEVPAAPRDPILGMTEQFNADIRTNKINLGVGVYQDEAGKLPLLKAVKAAEDKRVASSAARGYLPIDGIATYNQAVQNLLFGASSEVVKDKRIATVQCLGGTGALKVGADLLKRFAPGAAVYISDPSWENHRALFESAGFVVHNYAYYDPATHGLNFEGMKASIAAAPAGSIIVLHACCHNPTGVDLSSAQWDEIIALVKVKGHIGFLDMAYQGFGDGIDADAAAVGKFTAAGVTFLVSSSFSKSFSLYGERVGALSAVCQSTDEAARVLSQLKRVVRTNYSNPPTHGGTLVSMVLNDPALRQQWEDELAAMRERIKLMRGEFVDGLKQRGVAMDFDFVRRQRGMFSYSGITAAQAQKLRDDYGVYALDTGRICVAALNDVNLERVLDSIAAVVKAS
jgi:aromatic-amino-acid transaminase